jgi:hypothetical protein
MAVRVVEKMRKQRNDAVLDYRSFQVRAQTLNEEERTFEAVIASETPVEEIDWKRMEVVPRVLLASGAEWPSQVPLLDSHHRRTTDDQIGSIRQLRIEGGELVGRAHLSSESTKQWNKVREGHITDMSAGFRVLRETYVPEGKTQVIEGRTFRGPLNVATKWRLFEGSIVPIGGDEQAKLRGLDPSAFKPPGSEGGSEMKLTNEQRQQMAAARGLPADATDEQLIEALLKPDAHGFPAEKRDAEPTSTLNLDEFRRSLLGDIAKTTKQLLDEERAAQAKFRAEIDGLCEIAGRPDLKARCYEQADLDAVWKLLIDERAKSQADVPFVAVVGSSRDEGRKVLGSALNERAINSIAVGEAARKAVLPETDLHKDRHRFRNASLLDFARECLLIDGYRWDELRGLTKEQLAKAALGFPREAGLRAGEPYHVTGSFPLITSDAMNKSMRAGYEEFPRTWSIVFRQAASVPDFKNINRFMLGALPNLPIWPDTTDPERASFAEERVQYAVEAYSQSIDFSWRLMINDDMDALTRMPSQLGVAASRTVNAFAWAQITSNPTMQDGQALFLETPTGNRKRSNLTTGAATPTTATLQTMTNKMRQMRWLNTPEGNESQDILNLSPAFIVGPGALETTIRQLVQSTYDPADANMKFNTASSLQPLIEPLLDVASTTAWYLFARPSMVDTVEVTFLQGQESPATRTVADEKKLCQSWIVLQTFAAKAIDHRGMQKHNGA